MKKIALTRGKYALVDNEDYEYLMQWKWNAQNNSSKYTFYALRTCYDNGKKTVRMHRALCDRYGIEDYDELDHIDRNGLNNQKENLRVSTRGENCHNRRNWGKYPKGVDRHISRHKLKGGNVKEYITYRSRINVNGKSIHLGGFKTVSEAEQCYNKAAVKYYPNYKILPINEPKQKATQQARPYTHR